MKPAPSVLVFDVGHGSCVFIEDGAITTVIDCKESTILIEFLLSRKIESINQVIISHADADHIDGILALIQTDYIKLGTVFVNPDASKDTETWMDLRVALQDAQQRGKLKVRTEIGAGMTDQLRHIDVLIEVVAPGIASRLSGPGGRTGQGIRATSNTMSVVLRLHHRSYPVMLIPGDLDNTGLGELIAQGKQLQADILLFPHHGGHIGHGSTPAAKTQENAEFAKSVFKEVKPKLLLFSIGRGLHSTPRPEIIKQLQAQDGTCQIHCTQLSEHCHANNPTLPASHLGDLPAFGRYDNKCCGGSIEIVLAGQNTVATLNRKRHINFVKTVVSTPLCKPLSQASSH